MDEQKFLEWCKKEYVKLRDISISMAQEEKHLSSQYYNGKADIISWIIMDIENGKYN